MQGESTQLVGRGFIWVTALAIMSIATLLESHLGLSLADEGFLWDGVNKTRLGCVPIRDFFSYDPGRYYWCVAAGSLFGTGVVGLRLAVALFQTLGLVCGLAAATRVVRSRLGLVAIGLVLCIWMIPRWKGFEHGISLMAVYVAVRFVESPTIGWHCVSGAFVGVASLIGRNHGLYALLAFAGLILLIHGKNRFRNCRPRLCAWTAGLAAGFLPLVAMFYFIPGLHEANLEWTKDMWDRGMTTLPTPVPWPWIGISKLGPWQPRLLLVSTGFGFVLAPLICLLLAFVSICTRAEVLASRSLILSGAFVGTMYLHHAFSSADTYHLAQAIAPALLGAVALCLHFHKQIWNRVGKVSLVLGVALTCPAALMSHPSAQYLSDHLRGHPWVCYEVAGDCLLIPASLADYLTEIKDLVSQNVGADGTFLVAPYEPTLYAILDRTCPVANSYPLLPASELEQRRMVDVIKARNIGMAIISDRMLRSKDELRFRFTHPVVWQYLHEHFREITHIRDVSVMVRNN